MPGLSELVQWRLGILFLIIVIVVIAIIIIPEQEGVSEKSEKNNDLPNTEQIKLNTTKSYGSYDPPQRYRETQLYEKSLGRGEINSGILWKCRKHSPCGKCSVCQRNGDGY